MTQIISTLARLLLWAWHSGHTPASRSTLYPLLTDLLQGLVSLFPTDLVTLLAVFSPLMQHCQQEVASTKLVRPMSLLLSLSKLMDVKTSLLPRPVANPLVSSDHWLG